MQNGTARKILLSAARIVVAITVFFPALLYFFQSYLIFFPRPLAEGTRDAIARNLPNAREIDVTSSDGLKLHGWLWKPTDKPASPLLIYFGGNAEEVSWNLEMAEHFNPWSVALFNYRGYGLSEGKPSEANLFDDALTLYDHLASREDIDASRIVAMGRSLGSGVAVYLAANRPIQAVVLVSPFDSVTSVAQDIYPWVPVSWLIKHPFDSISRAPAIEAPMLMLAASDDRTIPMDHSRRLFDAWAGLKQSILINGANHDSISASIDYWTSIGDFLRALD